MDNLAPLTSGGATSDVSRRHDLLWERELPYEARTLRLIDRCALEEDNHLLSGDKSGSVRCFDLRGRLVWHEDLGDRGAGGPVYDLAFIHPFTEGERLVDPREDRCYVAAGTARGDLIFLEYLTGTLEPVRLAGTDHSRLNLPGGVLSLLYVECLQELWVGLAAGRIDRMSLSLADGRLSLAMLSPIKIGEAASALSFIPSREGSAEGRHRKGWVCAGTSLGNLYVLDPLAERPVPAEICQPPCAGPIRSCLTLSREAARYGWRSQVLALAQGGDLRYVIHDQGTGDPRDEEPIVLSRSCADRVFCLAPIDFGDSVWLAVGANDRRLQFFRIFHRDARSGLASLFADREFTLPFSGALAMAVRRCAGKESGAEREIHLYAALGDHRLVALKPLQASEIAARARGRFQAASRLKDLLEELRQAPDDAGLRRNLITLLFRTDWLDMRMTATSWDARNQRRLRLLIYQLLAGTSSGACHEIQSGLVEMARKHAELRPTAARLVRHIAKYCLDGESFSKKRRRLDQLAAYNERSGEDYLSDAALYHSLLAERRYSEQEVFPLEAPLTSLQRVGRPLPLSDDLLLATSYERGVAWLLPSREGESLTPEGERRPLPKLQARQKDGGPAAWLQQAVLWENPRSGELHALFFYRNLGWTSISLSELTGESLQWLEPPHPVEGCNDPFYIYSYATLPGGWIAVGGRAADLRLLRVFAAEGGRLRLSCSKQRFCAGPDLQYAPVRALAFRAFEQGGGELFAGCDNGACYRVTFDGRSLGEPTLLQDALAPIRVIACQGVDQVILGDGGGLLLLLRRLPTPGTLPAQPAGEFGIEWAVQLNAGATGLAATTLRVPHTEDGSPTIESRRIVAVSDSSGVLHVLRLDEILEHSFAIRLDGAPVEHLLPLSGLPKPAPFGETRIAVGCFDQTIRILSIGHRRESVRLLNASLTRAVIQVLHEEHPDLESEAVENARQALNEAVDSNVSIPEVRQRVLGALASLSSVRAIGDEDLVAALAEVGWKLASAKIHSEAARILSLRLRFDDKDSFTALLAHLRALATGAIRTPEGQYPHLQLRYCLRFGFKAIARLLDDEPAPSADVVRQLASFVHCCHDLAQFWGPESSIDNLRCKLAVAHMFFRFASPHTLEWLLGHRLDEGLASIGGRSMSSFLEDRLLNDPRLPIPFRAVHHVRRMIENDGRRALHDPVLAHCLPLLIKRFRQCRTMKEDAWVGMEIYLCIWAIHEQYGYPLWTFVTTLLHQGCSPSLLGFLAARQRVLPPGDDRCQEIVEALQKTMGAATGDRGASEGCQTLFERLSEPNGRGAAGADAIGLVSCLRLLASISIAFDPHAEHGGRARAREAIGSDTWASAEARSIEDEELRRLLDCARILIALSATEPLSSARDLYRKLCNEFELLVKAGQARNQESGTPDDDVLRNLFLSARESLRRQMRIELDFVAPMRFLQEGANPNEASAEEMGLVKRLSDFARLQGELAQAETGLFLRLDPDRQGVVVAGVVGPPLHRLLKKTSEVKRTLAELLGSQANFEPLRQEALRLLEAKPPEQNRPSIDLFQLTPDSLGEIIPVDRDDQRYGLLFFAYRRAAAPDPSQRALSRMVPQFLVSQFMRSIQMHQLLSVTFHHVSSPVAAMKSIIRLLRAGRIEKAKEPQFFEKLWFLVEDCRVMIENHWRYARLVRGIALQVDLRRFDIVEEVEFRRQVVHYKYEGRQQTLRWAGKAKPTMVNLDRMMVGDIVQNLLDNACKYSPAKTQILIEVQASKKDIFLVVSDEGPGLPEHVVASLFAEGVRGEPAAESKTPGLGLGLFMVYSYSSWLGGNVWYEDSELGGTKFTVRLPREGRT